MIRPVLTELILFAVPFALYALFVWVTKRGGVLERANWPLSHVLWLLIAAFLLVIGSFLVLAQWGGAPPRSTYVPAHIENGKFVPGETK
jgi:heme/copper-type cytochrome/quinol oxidase subunit 3